MIREKEVRVISDDGEQLGILSIRDALKIAEERNLDLVEVAANASPVVCKIMDFGKFKYEKTKKEKEAKKKQKVIVVKEIKVKPRIDSHDMETKVNHIHNFLEKDFKVKVSLMLFGRERMHAELGVKILDEIAESFTDTSIIEKKYDEGQKFLIISPKNK